MRISAKKLIEDLGISKEYAIELIDKGLTIYNSSGKVISLSEHRLNFGHIASNCMDLDKTYDEVWKDYTDAFDFGGAEDSIKDFQMECEDDMQREALIQLEYALIVKDYYFEKSEFEKTIHKIETGRPVIQYSVDNGSDDMLVVNADPMMWKGLSPEEACKNMKKAGMPNEVIAYVLSKKIGATQYDIGKVITGEVKNQSAHEKWTRRLLKAFERTYNPF